MEIIEDFVQNNPFLVIGLVSVFASLLKFVFIPFIESYKEKKKSDRNFKN